MRSKFSTRRPETHAQGVRVGRYKIYKNNNDFINVSTKVSQCCILGQLKQVTISVSETTCKLNKENKARSTRLLVQN